MKQSIHSHSERETQSAATAVAHARRTQSASAGDVAVQHKLAETAQQSVQSVAQRALDAQLNESPRMAMQRKQMEGMASGTTQLQAEEEEPMQGKFDAVQRAGVEEEEPLQGKFDAVQRAGVEEEEPLQGKFDAIQRAGVEEEEPLQGKFAAPGTQIQRKADNNGLPGNLKAGVESLSGVAMNDVQVHYNSPKPAQVQAHAYAQGTDIHVAPGQEKHLPHEAWHVAQQKQGRVQPTMQAMGVAINDDAGLEQEADVMGAKAVQAKAQEES